MQIGMITLTFQLASRYCNRWSVTGPINIRCRGRSNWHVLYLKWSGAACAGGQFGAVLLAAALVGTGSSVFHPDLLAWPVWLPAGGMAWRNLSSGRRQLWQLPGPLAGGGDYRPYGKGNVAWFVLAALLAIVVWRKSAAGTRHSTE